ncbi:uncharacterized protein LOC128953697 [Oppia nitens]|uniref:uncharacterized protein LOC128953697 n=1 Tax=Oppia nitens TaxID=1686743 RepID=UPI0023DAFD4A|nr:uncharacterized protein LOC128953697 [Oppia nitens]
MALNSTTTRVDSQAYRPMTVIVLLLIISVILALIDAQDVQENENAVNGVINAKRTAFLPSRGRRYWPTFDSSDNNDNNDYKRMSKFLPMRGRKQSFLPVRGRNSTTSDMYDDYLDVVSPYGSNNNNNDYNSEPVDKRAAFMPSRGKKAFYGMRGRK